VIEKMISHFRILEKLGGVKDDSTSFQHVPDED